MAGGLPGSGSSSPAAAAASGSSGGSSKPGKAELEARVAYLQEAAKNYDDPGACEACYSFCKMNVLCACAGYEWVRLACS